MKMRRGGRGEKSDEDVFMAIRRSSERVRSPKTETIRCMRNRRRRFRQSFDVVPTGKTWKTSIRSLAHTCDGLTDFTVDGKSTRRISWPINRLARQNFLGNCVGIWKNVFEGQGESRENWSASWKWLAGHSLTSFICSKITHNGNGRWKKTRGNESSENHR